MLSNKDKAIKELIDNERVLNTFASHVIVDNEDLPTIVECETCWELELFRTCHIWQGQSSNGYGYFSTYSKESDQNISLKAHRFAYAREFGFDALPTDQDLNDGNRLVLNHTCHNRLCVNPYHLEVITSNENISKKKRKPTNG